MFFQKSQNQQMKSLNHHCVPLDNVILTPHVGGSTQEAQANIGLEVAEKFVRYSDQGDNQCCQLSKCLYSVY